MIDSDQLRELEPHSAGVRAIHVPESGIVDYRQVCDRLADIIRERGGAIEFKANVSRINQSDNRIELDAGSGNGALRG